MTTPPAPGVRPASAIADVPRPCNCDSYTRGHTVHWVQERASRRVGPEQPCTVRDVTDDGTITFADGSTCWHHDPQRLRIALANVGNQALLCALGVLRVQDATDPQVRHCFSVDSAASPCLLPRVVPGESIAVETARRGGATRDVAELLEEFGGPRSKPAANGHRRAGEQGAPARRYQDTA